MREVEQTASAYIGRRLEQLRLVRGLTAKRMGIKTGMSADAYRRRELGLAAISLDFLLRCHLALGLDSIEQLWFPVDTTLACVDDDILAIQIGFWERIQRPVTLDEVIETCAEAFGVPVGAITGGLSSLKVRKARTAAAMIVSSRPHLRLSDLAPLVGRSRRALWWMRKQAIEADSELLRRVRTSNGRLMRCEK